ncbi:helix-turn-helix domain-containing protein [Nocardia fluminea]|uniref:Helix-turn-helix protein n=1 Tax=Nocardia fluminea TaxID=134984 RepID=A0A2N3VFF2_9NOCA|nr:helix-turn-helix domain-containing protein [Nocardia fluminea]PKV80348.1 helix-turn-helix protein [Nocardia fluminea]
MKSGGTGWDFAGSAEGGAVGAVILGYRAGPGQGLDLRVAAAPAVTVVIDFGDAEFVVDDAVGRQRLTGLVAGPSLAAMRVRCERAQCIEIRMSPIRAYSLLGVSPRDVGRGVVALEELWGGPARRLRAGLAAASDWDERFALTKSFLAQGDMRRMPDSEVVASWNGILAARGQIRVADLAASCGWSRKRLWSRFESQIGLTPKRAAMLVRFRCAVDGLLAGRPAVEVAAECGYADQAHLHRDVSLFADSTPGVLAARYLPDIARYRHRAWGTFSQYPPGPFVR